MSSMESQYSPKIQSEPRTIFTDLISENISSIFCRISSLRVGSLWIISRTNTSTSAAASSLLSLKYSITEPIMEEAVSGNLMVIWCRVRTKSCLYLSMSSSSLALLVLESSFLSTNTISLMVLDDTKSRQRFRHEAAALTAEGALDSVIRVPAASYRTAGLDEFSNARICMANFVDQLHYYQLKYVSKRVHLVNATAQIVQGSFLVGVN
ncbi:hypothetical protein BpHYR1_041016 [Brachionus plicatilis]|uniref:Uncharacterized protein n=1 Tax=Brachionus plicatilis TaxID=10195 RepID=A0A3M7R2I6_BRAPC|nr:hypothetical protein BpHYR1_041016 [Brachionus plicatilis]